MAVADDQEAIASPLFVVEAHEALYCSLWHCGGCCGVVVTVDL